MVCRVHDWMDGRHSLPYGEIKGRRLIMYRKLCFSSCLVLLLAGSALGEFETVGIYDPNDGPYYNQVDQSGTYASHTADAGPGNVIDLQTFQALIEPAFDIDAGGVVDVENGSMEGQSIVAKFGVKKTKSVTINNTSGSMSRGTGTGSGNRQPTSGQRRFSKSDTEDFVFEISLVGGGKAGEAVIYFAATVIHRDDRNINPIATATFSGGGTVTATAEMAIGSPSYTKDTFFGFVAPSGQSIVSVNFDLGNYTFLDDVAFITSAFNPEPKLAWSPNPASAAEADVEKTTHLTWLPGYTAASHDVYFGDNFQDVNAGTGGTSKGNQKTTRFAHDVVLELGKTYYWRVDEVESDGTTKHKGHVWSFTVATHVIVDDFESYTSLPPDRIFEAWRDGRGFGRPGEPLYYPGNGTGSLIGNAEPPYVEQVIVHGGTQSMPYYFDNNKQGCMNYSEAGLTLSAPRDWTKYGVKALSLWFRGWPESVGSFVQGPAGTYTMTAGGEDIWYASDQFHFAWKMLSGVGSIVAKVESVDNTDDWAKAGVMIRESLEPGSKFAAVYITPGNGCRFQARLATGVDAQSDSSIATEEQKAISAPYWVKLERTIAGDFNAYYSSNGVNWSPMAWNPRNIQMNMDVHIGLALTSHNPTAACQARFSDVGFPSGSITGDWANQDIGIMSNEAERMYVAISDASGTTGIDYYGDGDPNATLINTFTEWPIDLKKFSDKGVNLTDVNKISIGFGNRDNPQPGGSGTVYFDDIRLYQPRCLPSVLKSQGDLNNDCAVDYVDLQIMASGWLEADRTATGLLAHWRFDGNAEDSSGNNHHGDANGTPIYVSGKFGQAIQLDGDGDYVEHNIALPLKAGTLTHWLKPNMLKRMIAYYEGSELENGWTGGDNDILEIHSAINETDGRWYFCYQDGPGGGSTATITVSAAAQAGVWTHVAATWDRAGDLIIYADGVEVGRIDLTGEDFRSNIGIYHRIGGPSDIVSDLGKPRQWDGAIDDVRIYDRALTAAEIVTVMNGGTLGLHYYPVTTPANVYDPDPINSKKIDLKDLAVLAESWLSELLWPQP